MGFKSELLCLPATYPSKLLECPKPISSVKWECWHYCKWTSIGFQSKLYGSVFWRQYNNVLLEHPCSYLACGSAVKSANCLPQTGVELQPQKQAWDSIRANGHSLPLWGILGYSIIVIERGMVRTKPSCHYWQTSWQTSLIDHSTLPTEPGPSLGFPHLSSPGSHDQSIKDDRQNEANCLSLRLAAGSFSVKNL